MKNSLPQDHGLSESVLNDPDILPRVSDGSPSLTDIQYDALQNGVARGKSMLVVAPTSTGKTMIGVWALLEWVMSQPDRRAVYLVTHRALARQKFDELSKLLCDRHFDGDKRCIVLANGDTVEDGDGNSPDAPLDAPVLIATYEKYMAMLSGAGIPKDMSAWTVICDEIQILGEEGRGRNIEILLTLMRQSRWGQLVGLSAVLDARDADSLKDWLDVQLVRTTTREKHLIYECRTPTKVRAHHTENPEQGINTREKKKEEETDTVSIVAELMKKKDNLPIVVFCMSRARVHETARMYGKLVGVTDYSMHPILPELSEATEAAHQISCFIPKRFAIHTADLLEEERQIVEDALLSRKVDLVFSTTTLASGVNFPFKTAIFDNWKRYNGRLRVHEPIPSSEFHNMAGRAGRMGYNHDNGRIIFVAQDGFSDSRAVAPYLNPDQITPLIPRIAPNAFGQIALQLLSSGMCHTEEEIMKFLADSFSGMRENDKNQSGLDNWKSSMAEAVSQLKSWGYVL